MAGGHHPAFGSFEPNGFCGTCSEKPRSLLSNEYVHSAAELNQVHVNKCRRQQLLKPAGSSHIGNGLDMSTVERIGRECGYGCFSRMRPTISQPSPRPRVLSKPKNLVLTKMKPTPGHVQNERWALLADKIEPYLDVYSLLILRMTCKALYVKKFQLGKRALCFRGFVGHCCSDIFTRVFPLVQAIYNIPKDIHLTLDYGHVVDMRDAGIVYTFTKCNNITNILLSRGYINNIRELLLDFCTNITDQGIEILLESKLPYLENLSLSCIRNPEFKGLPFVSALSLENWPRFHRFTCACSSIDLDAVSAIADFFAVQEQDKDKEIAKCKLDIVGSWASRIFLNKLGLGHYVNTLVDVISMESLKFTSKLTKKVQRDLERHVSTFPFPTPLQRLLRLQGSVLLTNCPITTHKQNYWTLPLCMAVKQQNAALVNLLIKRGARTNVWDYIGKSPLYRACELGNLKVLQELIVTPMPAEFLSLGTCMSTVLQTKKIEALRMLINAGFPVNVTCNYLRGYKSPLYVAASVGFQEGILYLLSCGADPNWRYHSKGSPTLVAYQHDPQLLSVFLEHGAGEQEHQRWVLVEVFCCAAARGDLKSILLLLQRYPDLIECEQDIWSRPLAQACRLGNLTLVNLLIDHGANLNAQDYNKNTALHIAIEEGYYEIAHRLIKVGCKLDVFNAKGFAPLHVACMESRENIVYALQRAKCNVNIQAQNTGETALMISIKCRLENSAMALLNFQGNGLDFCACDFRGRSALVYCCFYSQYSIGEAIINLMHQSNLRDTKQSCLGVHAIVQERLNGGSVDRRRLKKFLKLYMAKCAPLAHKNK